MLYEFEEIKKPLGLRISQEYIVQLLCLIKMKPP